MECEALRARDLDRGALAIKGDRLDRILEPELQVGQGLYVQVQPLVFAYLRAATRQGRENL